LLGDLTILHDLNSLALLRDQPVTLVEVNNDGGGIFHHLPQASNVDQAIFEAIYGTPHGLNFAQLAGALGLMTRSSVHSSDDLRDAVSMRGPSLIEIRTDRNRDVEAHRNVHSRVAQALS